MKTGDQSPQSELESLVRPVQPKFLADQTYPSSDPQTHNGQARSEP